VIDTGVDATHHDLAGNVLSGADFSDGDVSTGNGHTDLVGHGTGVAGIIAGHGHGPHDEDGVLGVAPQAKILPVRDGLDIGFGITPAVKWATSHGAQVICIAQGDVLGGNLPDLDTAIEAAEDANIVVVAAAGNVPIENRVGLPAALPGVIAAAGTDENGNHALVSVTGSQVVIAAPATDVVQPFPNHRYAVGTGTSVSAAVIAGAAALIRSRFPKLSAKEVVDRLTATAIDKGPPGRDFEYGYGLVNIVGALTATIPSSGVSPSAPRTVASTSPKTSARHSVAPHAGDHKTAAEVGVVAAIFVVGVALAWVLKHRHNR
jgi:subtilisin family serine protease